MFIEKIEKNTIMINVDGFCMQDAWFFQEIDIFQTALLHFYPIWEAASVDEWVRA